MLYRSSTSFYVKSQVTPVIALLPVKRTSAIRFPTHCLLLCAIEADDLLDSVKNRCKSNGFLSAQFNQKSVSDARLKPECVLCADDLSIAILRHVVHTFHRLITVQRIAAGNCRD